MPTTTQLQPRSNVFCLTGMLASALLIVGMLGEGNARSIPVNLHPQMHSSSSLEEHRMAWADSQVKRENRLQKRLNQAETHREESQVESQPKKKRMGLALLFLGMLAEER